MTVRCGKPSLLVWAAMSLICSGCGDGASTSASNSEKPKQQVAAAPPVIVAQPPAIQPSAGNAGAASPPPNTTSDPAPTASDANTKKAEMGVGKKGSGYGGGIITEPVRVYFRQQERLEFLKIEHAMNLFKASNDRLPRTHEEFMEKIIQENAISLPQLPAGDSYFYDPQKGELFVKRREGVSP